MEIKGSMKGKIIFRVLNERPLLDYRQACAVTQGRLALEDDGSAAEKDCDDWWVKQICANHSTLRSVRFRMIAQAPKSVIMQVIRATKGHPQPEVQSSRPDWNGGKERGADPYEEKLFMQDHTAESFTAMAAQRLCMRTEARTRRFMEEAVRTLMESGIPFLRAVGMCCLPQCGLKGSCPELKPCGRLKTRTSDMIIRRSCERQ